MGALDKPCFLLVATGAVLEWTTNDAAFVQHGEIVPTPLGLVLA